jgi:mannose-6-phosphate isomerase-like protein (cupin superfamily)
MRGMAAYTHLNFKDVDDAAVNYGMSPNLEFRVGRKPLELENLGVSFLRMAPGFRMPFGHKHKTQEEVYVLLAGSARAKVDDDIVELKQWDALRLSKDAVRALEAGPDGAELILVGAPATEGQDADLTQGWWSD